MESSNQRKVALAGFLASLCIFAVMGCAKREIMNAHSQGKNIICFGDSLTYGYGVEESESCPVILGKLFSCSVFNKGINGNTTVDALQRLNADVLENSPRMVIVEFGGNDFMNKIPISHTISNLRYIIAKIQHTGAMVALVDISSGLFLGEYRDAYKRLAQETKSLFIAGAFNGIITNPNLKSDFLHPNAQGYQLVAKRICQAIAPYLN